ncbi:MAG: hypothetical protein QOC64_2944, partial [Solirubrobacteraceae bacterium]|nr:hypothetical protein [Solirubrobacteraceae bacterium]
TPAPSASSGERSRLVDRAGRLAPAAQGTGGFGAVFVVLVGAVVASAVVASAAVALRLPGGRPRAAGGRAQGMLVSPASGRACASLPPASR